MACPIKEACSFFNNQMRISEDRQKMMKTRLCLSSYSECARFKVFQELKSTSKVPADLFPNDFNRAEMIINSGSKNNPKTRYF